MKFPQSFIWGAAAASYQVESAAYADGKGLSVGDIFCRKPGVIQNGENGMANVDWWRWMARCTIRSASISPPAT